MAWLKSRRLVQKGTLLHALPRSGGPLSYTCFDIGRNALDDPDTPMSVFAVRNTARSQVPSPRSGPRRDTWACLAAGLGIQELALETRQTDSMVGGSGAAGPADA